MTVAEFTHELAFHDLPQPVIDQARRCLLDLIGVAASGRRTDLARIVTRVATRQFGTGNALGARILLEGCRTSAVGAAYAGASLIDSFDAHDGHVLTKGHAGVTVLPAVMAFWDAERLSLDDREFLTAIVLGYEIATRAGISLHASACDYHTSGAWGAIAAAAIGARMLKLTVPQTREALGIAEYHGPRSQMMRCIEFPTMVKDGSGWGALTGVSAAYLAAEGFTGAPAVTVEGRMQESIWADLGQRWYILEQYFKPYPVCRWAQPAVEAVRQLMRAHRLSGTDIKAVEVLTFAEAVRLATAAPVTTEQAQYSLAFPLAAMIIRGRIGADEITGTGLTDRDILDLAGRITLIEDPEICARFPAERFAIAKLQTKDGQILRSDWVEARGGPTNPLTNEEVLTKFRDLAVPLGEGRSGAIESAVAALGTGQPQSAASLAELILTSAAE